MQNRNTARAPRTDYGQRDEHPFDEPRQPAPLAKVDYTKIVGRTVSDAQQLNKLLDESSKHFTLVAPATSVGSLPEGFGVALSLVHVDPRVDQYGSGADVFRVDGGKLALLKHKLDQIAAAAGVSWDAERSKLVYSELDYWHFKAVGTYVSYDGQRLTIQGEYEFDVRDGSERVREILEKVDNAKPNERAEAQYKASKAIRQMRKFGLRRAETGARTAAISELGLKRAATEAELARPFLVAKLQFTGQSDDPEIRKAFAVGGMHAFLGSGVPTLYGQQAPALPSRGQVIEHQQSDDDDDRAPPAQPPAARQPSKPSAPAKVYVLPRSNTPIAEAHVDQLERWERRIGDDLSDQLFDRDEVADMVELRDAITEELKRRKAAAGSKF